MEFKKFIFLCLTIIGSVSCSDNDGEVIEPPKQDQTEDPIVEESEPFFNEAFDNQENYNEPLGGVFPLNEVSDGYFTRNVLGDNNEEKTLKVYLKECTLNVDAEPVIFADGTSSKGCLEMTPDESYIETRFFCNMSSFFSIIKNISDANCTVSLMYRTKDSDWKLLAETPELSSGKVIDWEINDISEEMPMALKIVANGGDIALYDLLISGDNIASEEEETFENLLFEENFNNEQDKPFYTDAEGVIWNDFTNGYFERDIQGTVLRVDLGNCKVDYYSDAISIYGTQTSKGNLQIGTDGYIEFPLLGYVDGLFISYRGDIIVEFKEEGQSEYQSITSDFLSNCINIRNISDNACSIRIKSSTATNENPLVIYDLKVSGTKDPNIILINERFRDIKIYFDASNNQMVADKTLYKQIYFEREVDGQKIRCDIYDARFNVKVNPPAHIAASGATQGLIKFDPEGYMEISEINSVKSMTLQLGTENEGDDIKVKIEVKESGTDEWITKYESAPIVKADGLTWKISNVSDKPASYRISSVSADHIIYMYNLTITGKMNQ